MVAKEKNMKVAIICAREGSSRIKNKNLKILNNKPLIFYTVEAAINSKIFDKIYINSDSKKILKQVKKHYSHNKLFFYLRPKAFGAGNIFVIDVIKEMISSLKIKKNYIAFILFPTCPLRSHEDIKKTYKFYKKKRQSIVTVSRFDPPVSLSLKLRNGKLTPQFKEKYNLSTRHNDHKTTYFANFAIIIKKVSKLLRQRNLIGNDSVPFQLPFISSLDIDEKYQFDLAKKILKFKK